MLLSTYPQPSDVNQACIDANVTATPSQQAQALNWAIDEWGSRTCNPVTWLANVTTSLTSQTIASRGTLTFTTQQAANSLWWPVGSQVRIVDSTGNNWFEGTVVSYIGQALTVKITNSNGSGTIASWSVYSIRFYDAPTNGAELFCEPFTAIADLQYGITYDTNGNLIPGTEGVLNYTYWLPPFPPFNKIRLTTILAAGVYNWIGLRSIRLTGTLGYATGIPTNSWQGILMGAVWMAWVMGRHTISGELKSVGIGSGDLNASFVEMKDSPLYTYWQTFDRQCRNPNVRNYGGAF